MCNKWNKSFKKNLCGAGRRVERSFAFLKRIAIAILHVWFWLLPQLLLVILWRLDLFNASMQTFLMKNESFSLLKSRICNGENKKKIFLKNNFAKSRICWQESFSFLPQKCSCITCHRVRHKFIATRPKFVLNY